MKQKVLYIVSNISKSLAFEWIAERVDENKFDLEFLLIHSEKNTGLYENLVNRGRNCHYIKYQNKKDLLSCLYKVYKVVRKFKPDVVHTHLFEASMFGLLISKLLGVKKRIHTRHHSTFHWDYFPRAVTYDKFINFLSTQIVSISSVVSEVLLHKENVRKDKVKLVPHGFPFDEFTNVSLERTNKLKKRFNLEASVKVIGAISRFIHWKGVEYIIRAFKIIKLKEPNTKLVLANATGPLFKELTNLIGQLGLEEDVVLIDFEDDIAALYQCFEVFVHVPIDGFSEAFGQIYVEAFLAGVPSVVTHSGVSKEFIHSGNAVIVPYQNAEAIAHGVLSLLNDENRFQSIVAEVKSTDLSRYQLSNHISNLEELYVG